MSTELRQAVQVLQTLNLHEPRKYRHACVSRLRKDCTFGHVLEESDEEVFSKLET
jgi:hypothetical protein